jgi:hypothetical protein
LKIKIINPYLNYKNILIKIFIRLSATKEKIINKDLPAMLNKQLKTLLSSFILISFCSTPNFSQQETANQLLQEKPIELVT